MFHLKQADFFVPAVATEEINNPNPQHGTSNIYPEGLSNFNIQKALSRIKALC